MKQRSLNKEKLEKKSKTKKKPDETGEPENAKVGENSGESALAKKLKKDKDVAQRRETRKAPRNGAKRALRKAVNTAVKAHSEGIALSLVERTASGDMRGAAMMISLMEPGNRDRKDEKNERSGPSLADLLESEPPWHESMVEDSEVDAGGRESEMQATWSSK